MYNPLSIDNPTELLMSIKPSKMEGEPNVMAEKMVSVHPNLKDKRTDQVQKFDCKAFRIEKKGARLHTFKSS